MKFRSLLRVDGCTDLTPLASVRVLTAALFVVACPVSIGADAAATGRVPTMTLHMKVFGELENQLADSVLGKNAAQLERVLTPDFEMRVADRPGQPVPRDLWVKSVLADAGPACSIEQMAVHEVGDARIVSFLLKPRGGGKQSAFVVDTWVGSGDDWKLKIRYVGSASLGNAVVHGNAAVKSSGTKQIN